MSRHRTAIAVVALVVVTAGLASAFAQSANELTGEPLLRALLAEMRSLRLSMQKNSAYELRGRLLLERARLHQEVIRELSREIEGASEILRPGESEMMMETEMEIVEGNIEARFAAHPNPEERKKMIEREKMMMERRKAMELRHREQMRVRFQRMETRLAEEREKLRAIEEELAQIQRELMAGAQTKE